MVRQLSKVASRKLIEALCDACISRWPEVYGPARHPKLSRQLVKSVDSAPSTGQAITDARQTLLDIASSECDVCPACELSANRYGRSVFGDGDVTSEIMLIGEGPGQYEQRTLIPFVTNAELRCSRCMLECASFEKCFPFDVMYNKERLPDTGCNYMALPEDKLREVVDKRLAMYSGVAPNTVSHYLNSSVVGRFWKSSWNNYIAYSNRDTKHVDLYVTNVIKCRSCDACNGDKSPQAGPVAACGIWLDIQLQIVQPRVIITLGSHAGKALLNDPDFKVSRASGKFYEAALANSTRLPARAEMIGHAYHPSAISRQESASVRDEWVHDLDEVLHRAYHHIHGDLPDSEEE